MVPNDGLLEDIDKNILNKTFVIEKHLKESKQFCKAILLVSLVHCIIKEITHQGHRIRSNENSTGHQEDNEMGETSLSSQLTEYTYW